MNSHDPDHVEPSGADAQTDYEPPAIFDIGTVAELTQFGAAGTMDAEGQS